MALQKATTVANGVCEAISSAAAPAAATPTIASTADLQPQVLMQTTKLLPGATSDPDFGAAMKDVMVKAKDQLKGVCHATCMWPDIQRNM